MNTNIKLYEDGDRLILVFENASIGIKEMIQNLLAPAVAVRDLVPSHIKEEQAPDLEGKSLINEKTAEQTKEISRFAAGKYAGMTPQEALQSPAGFRELYTSFQSYCENERMTEEINNALMLKTKTTIGEAELMLPTWTLEDMKKFLTTYDFLFPLELKQVVEQAGYADSSSFLEREDASMLMGACQYCIQAMKERLKEMEK